MKYTLTQGKGTRDIKLTSKLSSLCMVPMCASPLIGVHAMTGCDTTSAFVRKGKIRPLKIVTNDSEFNYRMHFKKWGMERALKKVCMQHFVCKLYGKNCNINKPWYLTAKTKFGSGKNLLSGRAGTDLSLIPSSRATLWMHFKRANFQTLIWKNSHSQYPEIPSPTFHGWKEELDIGLNYDWFEAEILPLTGKLSQ